MRPHGKARVDSRNPRAHGICERCGFRYNHHDLSWEMQWTGPHLNNLKHLVCHTCLDKPQEGLRTIVLPPDPVAIINARPENFTDANNPISGIGFDPLTSRLNNGAFNSGVLIGSMTEGGGLVAAFDSQPSKPSWRSARVVKSLSGFGNSIGCNWNNDPAGQPTPTGISSAFQSYSIGSAVINAPLDQPFLKGSSAISAAFQGSNNATTWFNLWSGNTLGAIGETLTLGSSVNLAATNYGAHRFVLSGDGINTVAVAQLTLTAAGPSAAQTAGIET